VATRHAGEACNELQILEAVERVVEIGLLGQEADARAAGDALDRLAEDHRRAARGLEEPGEDLERRGLAGAIRAQVAEHLAAVDVERQRLEAARHLLRPRVAVALAEPADADRGTGRGVRARAGMASD